MPLEARVGREMHRLTVALLGVDERRPGVREAVQATLDLLRGLGVANLLNDDSARRTTLLHTWKRQLAALLTPETDPPSPGPPNGTPPDTGPPDATPPATGGRGRDRH